MSHPSEMLTTIPGSLEREGFLRNCWWLVLRILVGIYSSELINVRVPIFRDTSGVVMVGEGDGGEWCHCPRRQIPSDEKMGVINKQPNFMCLTTIKLYYFFRVNPRSLDFMCRRFGALSHFHRRCKQVPIPPVKVEQNVLKRRYRGFTHRKEYDVLYSWDRASQFCVNKCPTRCNYTQFICKLLYMFRVVCPPITRSTNNCIYSSWY